MAQAFVPLSQGANELGASSNTIKRRFRSLGLTVFRDSRDLRRRLVQRSDLEAAFGPPVPTITRPPAPDFGPSVETGASRLCDS